ncbi:hypothetical protein FH969_06565 [Miniimonas arenae]|uniref:Nitroreductase n=1 Tax=Miniimonas arenae TaxID=676201 RepID=A0A5C5BBQ5_9MICO|nr:MULTISPECIES: hypothetical protein [Miniimonas]TNU74981.1 hypothetical protein FH969_06565 [Miniimonas arenae]
MVEQDRIISAIEDATYASSIHNSQPWRFTVLGDAVAVSLDPDATPRTVDPSGRWALASIGAVLATLEIALVARTGLATSTELRVGDAPSDGELAGGQAYGGRPLAIVQVGDDAAPAAVKAQAERLAPTVRERFTTRAPLTGGAPTQAEWAALSAAAGASELVTGTPAPEPLVRTLLALTAEAEVARQDDPDYLEEIERWVDNESHTGIPSAAIGLPDAEGKIPLRDFTQTPMGSAASGEATFFEDPAALLVLTSASDAPVDQLLGGYAMQRVMLEATALGLGIGVLGQALEEPDSREKVDAAVSEALASPEPVVVHQVLRLGHPAGELAHVRTPRRPVKDVILG